MHVKLRRAVAGSDAAEERPPRERGTQTEDHPSASAAGANGSATRATGAAGPPDSGRGAPVVEAPATQPPGKHPSRQQEVRCPAARHASSIMRYMYYIYTCTACYTPSCLLLCWRL